MTIRLARLRDLAALRILYAESVRVLGPGQYSPDQVRMWASFADSDGFDAFILDVDTYVAELTGSAVGFCGVATDGHVASVYVAPVHARRGLGGWLLRHALAARPRPSSGGWYAEASALSLPLFLRHGFRETGRERVFRQGVEFERHLVARAIVAAGGQAAPAGTAPHNSRRRS